MTIKKEDERMGKADLDRVCLLVTNFITRVKLNVKCAQGLRIFLTASALSLGESKK